MGLSLWREKHQINWLFITIQKTEGFEECPLLPRDKGDKLPTWPHLEAAVWKNVQWQQLVRICWLQLHLYFHTNKPKQNPYSHTTHWIISRNNLYLTLLSVWLFLLIGARQPVSDTYSFVGLRSWWPQRGGSIPEHSSPSPVHCGPAASEHTLQHTVRLVIKL